MKKLLFLFAFSLMTITLSCTSSEEVNQDNSKPEIVTKFKGGVKSPLEITKPTFYTYNESAKRPVELGYWECGSGGGTVYTNGYDTYTYTIYNNLSTAPANATYVWDEFSQTMYAYTTVWGGTCTSGRGNEEVPQETVDAITEIILNYERTGVEQPCQSCRCSIKTRSETPGGSVTYSFQCSSGNSYWASYCPLTGNVLVSNQYESHGGITLTPPPPPPCN